MVGVAVEGGGDLDVDREDEVDASLLGVGEISADPVDLVCFEKALADGMALCGEEGEEHAAAHEQVVDPGQEVLDDAELVGHLRAAQHDRVGACGVGRELLQDLELGRDEGARRAGEQLRELEHARLLTVDDSEAVRHEDVAECGDPLGEAPALRGVLRGLGRREPQVLEDRDLPVGEGCDGGRGLVADGLGDEPDALAEQLAESLSDGTEAVLGCYPTVGASEVADDDHTCSLVDQEVERLEEARTRPSSVIR
nr:hypothetical protein GCM10025699_53370 [Microbacterium flavescens]